MEYSYEKILLAAAAAAMFAGSAAAERYVAIADTQGTDPFWPVVGKVAVMPPKTARRSNTTSMFGDMATAKLIGGAATQPDGIIRTTAGRGCPGTGDRIGGRRWYSGWD